MSWLRYGVKIGMYSFRLDISSHMKEMLSTKLYYDQVAKLVEVDDEALEVFAKEKQEADGKKMEEAAKNNDLSKADFTEKGCGPITLGKKVKSLPDNYENLYTSYKWIGRGGYALCKHKEWRDISHFRQIRQDNYQV